MIEYVRQPGLDGGNIWVKQLMIWVGVLVALALLVTMVDGRSAATPGKNLSYSAFLNQVKEGGVAKVELAGTAANGTKKDASPFRTTLPTIPDPQQMPALPAANVDVIDKPEESPTIWQYI